MVNEPANLIGDRLFYSSGIIYDCDNQSWKPMKTRLEGL